MYVSLCGYMGMSMWGPWRLEMASGPLKVELQVVLSHLTWMRGTELCGDQQALLTQIPLVIRLSKDRLYLNESEMRNGGEISFYL